jgi:hypothetical protein
MSTNWDAVGAIGQWAGGLITALGIYLGIKTSKPSIKIEVLFIPDQSGGTIKIIAVNKRIAPTSIIRLNIRNVKYKKSLESSVIINVYLEPMGVAEVSNSIRWQAFKDKGVNNTRDICKLISVVDNLGNEYFVYRNLLAKIERILFYRILGKKQNS